MLRKKDVLRLARGRVYSVGYCQARYLLNYSRKVGYNAGRNGWNYDVYIVGDDDVIITGYKPFRAEKINYDLLKKYEESARKAQHEGWGDVKMIVNGLLEELLRVNKELNEV